MLCTKRVLSPLDRLFGASWGGLEGVLGPLGRLLGPLGALLEPLEAVLGGLRADVHDDPHTENACTDAKKGYKNMMLKKSNFKTRIRPTALVF